ncbi:hypothetical protein V6N12_038676 [Hibiscus sabdariffa]|uniref:Cytochrome P450 n=1 Tax=Hibiscus sabdariffa TaxID=183260 RepID=A0ABR2CBD7_9ROSI
MPAKTKVLVNTWVLGRDPKHCDDPETFYPKRFLNGSMDYMGTNYEFNPFGAGRRMCPGITFVTPNLELPLAQLLFHFDWKLPNGMRGEDLDMAEVFGVIVKRKNDIVLVPRREKGAVEKGITSFELRCPFIVIQVEVKTE